MREYKALCESLQREIAALQNDLHDRYTMAALTGLLANASLEGQFVTDWIDEARAYADEAMKQRGTQP